VTARKPIVQVVDDEWVEIGWRKQRESCCDCHLVHDVDYRVVDGKLQFRARQNARATAAARRPFKIPREED
jgi:hypothetical protein